MKMEAREYTYGTFFLVMVGREKEDRAEKNSNTKIIPNLKTIPRSSMNSKLQITSQ